MRSSVNPTYLIRDRFEAAPSVLPFQPPAPPISMWLSHRVSNKLVSFLKFFTFPRTVLVDISAFLIRFTYEKWRSYGVKQWKRKLLWFTVWNNTREQRDKFSRSRRTIKFYSILWYYIGIINIVIWVGEKWDLYYLF